MKRHLIIKPITLAAALCTLVTGASSYAQDPILEAEKALKSSCEQSFEASLKDHYKKELAPLLERFDTLVKSLSPVQKASIQHLAKLSIEVSLAQRKMGELQSEARATADKSQALVDKKMKKLESVDDKDILQALNSAAEAEKALRIGQEELEQFYKRNQNEWPSPEQFKKIFSSESSNSICEIRDDSYSNDAPIATKEGCLSFQYIVITSQKNYRFSVGLASNAEFNGPVEPGFSRSGFGAHVYYSRINERGESTVDFSISANKHHDFLAKYPACDKFITKEVSSAAYQKMYAVMTSKVRQIFKFE